MAQRISNEAREYFPQLGLPARPMKAKFDSDLRYQKALFKWQNDKAEVVKANHDLMVRRQEYIAEQMAHKAETDRKVHFRGDHSMAPSHQSGRKTNISVSPAGTV